MTLKEIQAAVDTLSFEQIKELRVYLEERLRLFDEAMAEIREGLTQAELDQLTADMNAEYIEDVDELK
jgi:hypothetical protein